MASVKYPFRTDCFGNYFLSSVELASFAKRKKPWLRIQRLVGRIGQNYVYADPRTYLTELEDEGRLLVLQCTPRLESVLSFAAASVTVCDDPTATFVAVEQYEEQYWESHRSDCTVKLQKRYLRRFILDTVQAHYVDNTDCGYELPDELYRNGFELDQLLRPAPNRFDRTIIWENGGYGQTYQYDAETDTYR